MQEKGLSPRARKDPVKVELLSHTYSRLVNADDYARVSSVLKYYRLDWQNRSKNNKPTVKYYNLIYKGSNQFQTGHIPYLEKFFSVEVSGYLSCLKPLTREPKLEGIKWYRDQQKIFDIAYNNRRGIIKAPTGSGKTLVAAGLIEMYRPKNCLFMIHTKDLLWQTVEEFKKIFGSDIGVIGDGVSQWSWITVGTVQSLHNMKDTLKDRIIDMVICDESHHSSSISYRQILFKLVDCSVRYGLTATPRKDKEGKLITAGVIGEEICDISSSDLIARNRLSAPEVIFKEVPFDMEIAVLSGYRNAYNGGIIYNDVRNRMIYDSVKELEKNGTVLVTVKEVKHGEELESIGTGLLIQGKTTSDERNRIKEAFKKKKIKTVIATTIWDEGIDVPALGSIVVAGGGLSERKTLQKVGRGLRKTEDKNTVAVVDFLDTQHHYLRKHSRERRKTYLAEGWQVSGCSEELFDGRSKRR